MHAGAKKFCDQKGVWKIGQAHVAEIKQMHDDGEIDDINYNIVTQQEFDEHFLPWSKAREKAKTEDSV